MIADIDIPGWHNLDELKHAFNLVSDLEEGSVIVELGSCAGRLTYVLAKNAPECQVYAIDKWDETERVYTGLGYNLDKYGSLTNDFWKFQKEMDGVGNVTPIRTDVTTYQWKHTNIDLLVIDCDCGFGQTDFETIINHWQKWTRIGGIICGYHAHRKRTDIRQQIANCEKGLAEKESFFLDDDTGFWLFKKRNDQ